MNRNSYFTSIGVFSSTSRRMIVHLLWLGRTLPFSPSTCTSDESITKKRNTSVSASTTHLFFLQIKNGVPSTSPKPTPPLSHLSYSILDRSREQNWRDKVAWTYFYTIPTFQTDKSVLDDTQIPAVKGDTFSSVMRGPNSDYWSLLLNFSIRWRKCHLHNLNKQEGTKYGRSKKILLRYEAELCMCMCVHMDMLNQEVMRNVRNITIWIQLQRSWKQSSQH